VGITLIWEYSQGDTPTVESKIHNRLGAIPCGCPKINQHKENKMNISSIVVQCKQENYDAVKETLEKSGLCDYHFGDIETGKIIITIEGKDVGEEIKKLTTIQTLPGIIAADMMQTYQEDQLDQEIKNLEASAQVPSMLNDTTIAPQDIVYNGDLKKKF